MNSNQFSGNLNNPQNLLGPDTSANRLAYYLYEVEYKHFGESIPQLTDPLNPHIFVHVLNHLISIGETFTINAEELNVLMSNQWMPENSKVVTNSPDSFTIVPD